MRSFWRGADEWLRSRVWFLVFDKREGLFYGTQLGYLPTLDPNKNMTCVKYISLKNL